jgi:hypothetical protein
MVVEYLQIKICSIYEKETDILKGFNYKMFIYFDKKDGGNI